MNAARPAAVTLAASKARRATAGMVAMAQRNVSDPTIRSFPLSSNRTYACPAS
jgi:hypothetical protein